METLVWGLVEAPQGFLNVALCSGVAVRGIGIDAAGDDERCSFKVRDFGMFSFRLCVALRFAFIDLLECRG